MSALWTQGVEFVVYVDEKHLCAFEALDFKLLLLAGFKVQGCEALELEFFGHAYATANQSRVYKQRRCREAARAKQIQD
jgi:hypothetical protein